MVLDEIRRTFGVHNPEMIRHDGSDEAAVAMVLQQGATSVEALFIERAKHPNDPWSGHMAFPGGRRDPKDPTLRAVAERETLEEVGIELGPAEPLGRLNDLEGYRAGRKVGLVISAFVYFQPAPHALSLSDEVERALWVPISMLWGRNYRVSHIQGGLGPYPGIKVGDPESHVVWGLTYRFVQCFLNIIGKPLTDDLGPHP